MDFTLICIQADTSAWYACLYYIAVAIHSQVNTSMSAVILKSENGEIQWKVRESILRKLESVKVVKDVFPLHGMQSATHLNFA